jgi:SAM-dependent methyltransferase
MPAEFPRRDYRPKQRMGDLHPEDRERILAAGRGAADPETEPPRRRFGGQPAEESRPARPRNPSAPVADTARDANRGRLRAALPGEPPTPAADTAWEANAAWYDQLIGEDGDDFYKRLILPAVEARLGAAPGSRVLDLACGNGVLGRVLAARGVQVTGLDASPALIAAATGRAGKGERYVVGDARDPQAVLAGQVFDHAALVMCLQDLDPIAPVLAGAAALVRPGGRLVMVLSHPCFRIPKRSSWGWDEDNRQQYRRIDTYKTMNKVPIRTHPGQEADLTHTSSFHRPLSTYLDACGTAGWGIVGCDEPVSHRRGTRGARSAAEDLALKEIPLFLVLAAVRLPG